MKTATLSQANSIMDDVKDTSCESKKTVIKAWGKLVKVSGCRSNYYLQWVVHGPRSVGSLYKQDKYEEEENLLKEMINYNKRLCGHRGE